MQSDAHIWSSLVILVPLHTGERNVDKLGLGFDFRAYIQCIYICL